MNKSHLQDASRESGQVAASSGSGIHPGNPDELVLTTLGVDIGSSTSHLMVSRLTMRRLGKSMYSKWVVADRAMVYRSPVLLTPYRPDFSIDASSLEAFVAGSLTAAKMAPSDVDTGVVVLTGEAVRRRNARAIADLFAEKTGKFVCASAGHLLEATVAAHGSGTLALSRHGPVLNIDIGGGTSKLAYCADGHLLGTAAINVGGRLVATSATGRIERIEPAAQAVAHDLGITLRLDEPLPAHTAEMIADRLADCLVESLDGGARTALTEQLMLTPPLEGMPRPERVTLSGGVAEYLRDPATADYGDIGRVLAGYAAGRIRQALGVPVVPAAEQLRATVIGLSQFTAQVSGDTVVIPHDDVLPLRNIPVVPVQIPDSADAQAVRAAVAAVLARGEQADHDVVVLSLQWSGRPSYSALRELAHGVSTALDSRIASGTPLAICVSQDCAHGLGRLLESMVTGRCPVICLDGLDVGEFDYVDIGRRIPGRSMVPVVVKSLVFPAVDPTGTALSAAAAV